MSADRVVWTAPAKRRGADVDPELLHARWHVMFALHFGIRPWEWDLLTWVQVLDLVAACERLIEDAKR